MSQVVRLLWLYIESFLPQLLFLLISPSVLWLPPSIPPSLLLLLLPQGANSSSLAASN